MEGGGGGSRFQVTKVITSRKTVIIIYDKIVHNYHNILSTTTYVDLLFYGFFAEIFLRESNIKY